MEVKASRISLTSWGPFSVSNVAFCGADPGFKEATGLCSGLEVEAFTPEAPAPTICHFGSNLTWSFANAAVLEEPSNDFVPWRLLVLLVASQLPLPKAMSSTKYNKDPFIFPACYLLVMGKKLSTLAGVNYCSHFNKRKLLRWKQVKMNGLFAHYMLLSGEEIIKSVAIISSSVLSRAVDFSYPCLELNHSVSAEVRPFSKNHLRYHHLEWRLVLPHFLPFFGSNWKKVLMISLT